MTFKVTNALRIISIIVLVVVFFLAYAGLPDQVLVIIDNVGEPVTYLSKNYFFYGTLTALIITNTLLYVVAILFHKIKTKLSALARSQIVAKYFLALAIILNVFFSVELSFIGILNGQENFDYTNFSPFFFLSGGLFVVWLLAFVYSLIRSKKIV